MRLLGEEWGCYVSFRRFAPPVDGLLAALALGAGAAMVLQSLSGFHWAKELKTFYSQEFSLEFDFKFI